MKKNIMKEVEFYGKKYPLAFDINVLEEIQNEYGSIITWAEIMSGENNSLDISAIKFGFTVALNEGIKINNFIGKEKMEYIDSETAGIIISEYGIADAFNLILDSVFACMNISEDDLPKNVLSAKATE